MYTVNHLNGKFSTDNFYPYTKSLRGNMCAQIFSNKIGFVAFYPLPAQKGDTIGKPFGDFIHDFGGPDYVNFDNSLVKY